MPKLPRAVTAVWLVLTSAALALSLPSPRFAKAASAGSSKSNAVTTAPKALRGKPATPTARKTAVPRKSAPKAPPPVLTPIPDDIRRLGPLSVGHPHAGYLVNGVKLPPSEHWVITVPSHGFGTQETNDALELCIGKVRNDIPESPKVMLGSLSAERGGYLPPHKSHRTGRDADVYFFRKPGARWLRAATEQDIDLKRTWALLRCFVTRTDVEMILIDRKVQRWLESYALSVGEDPAWIEQLFHDQRHGKTAVVRHVPGHVAHMHVRFVSPEARRKAVQHYDRLVAAKLVVPEQRGVVHVVQKGDTLSALAARYGVAVDRIRELNGLGSTLIRVGQKLTVEQAVDIRGARDGVVIPARRTPPGEPRRERVAVAAEPRRAEVAAKPVPDASAVTTPKATLTPSEPETPAASTPTPPGPPPRRTPEPTGRLPS